MAFSYFYWFDALLSKRKPNWQLPVGVSRATWDYIQAEHIATEYDEYFADSALMRLDLEVLQDSLPPVNSGTPPVIADLGCGTGRVSRFLLPLGYQLINVDLSQAMLSELKAKTPAEFQDRNQCVCANLVELDSVLDADSLDLAVCLFSSMGMIRGRKNRRRFLTAVHKTLRPGARFLVHVHNRNRSLFDPGGPKWLIGSLMKSFSGRDWEFGDRVYAYRRLPAMFLHIYSRRELLSDLRHANFHNIQLLPISVAGDRLLSARNPWIGLRAGGYFAIASG